MTDFSDLALAQPVAEALTREGYTTPTPIQSQAIPPALDGQDILGIAQTGTGKTAAFALPILTHLANNPRRLQAKSARVLVLAPTRELASQIATSFRAYGRNMKVSVATVFGGIPINRQIRELARGTDILVATPGRLLDLTGQNALSLGGVEHLVLDEADQMLDMGFIHSLRKIVPLLPKDRQTMFFSATMPKSIAQLAAQYLTDPVKVSVAPAATTAERVDQHAIFVKQADKQALLTLTLRETDYDRVLVFTRTKHGADRVVKHLARAGIEAGAIHGNKSQPQRERTLSAFRAGKLRILVATDIAARGIDIDGVSHVINFEVPNVPEQYVHRIGRTARAGADGLAMSFVAGDERPYLREIEKVTRQKVPVMGLPEGFDEAVAELNALPPLPKPERPQQNRGRGNANGGKGNKRTAAGKPKADGRKNGGQRNEQRGEQRAEQRGENRGERRSEEGRKDTRRPGAGKPKQARNGSGGANGKARRDNRRADWQNETVGAGASDTGEGYRKPRPRGSQRRRAKVGQRQTTDA